MPLKLKGQSDCLISLMENILILHGWGIGSKTWIDVKTRLEEKGCRVFVPDLPGFGQNSAPERPWDIDDYVGWVKDYCDKNDLSHFFLLGHSFGGGLAVKLINFFPEKIKGLILIAPKIRRQKNYRYYLGLILGKIGKIIFFIPIFSFLQPLARKILYWMLGVQDYYKLEAQKNVIMKETFKKIVGEELISFLSTIKSPTLIIWGKKDDVTPFKDAILINQEIEGSKLDVIEKGEHALNLQFPEILAQKVLNFINS